MVRGPRGVDGAAVLEEFLDVAVVVQNEDVGGAEFLPWGPTIV